MTRKLVFINDSNKSSSINSPASTSNTSSSSSSDRLSIITTINSTNLNSNSPLINKNNSNYYASPSSKCSQLNQESPIIKNKINKENMLEIEDIKRRNSISRNLKMRSSRLITTFEELANLEARSRQPIDIVNLSKKSDDLFPRLDEISIQTTPVSSNRKYFSFMTTNKQFNEINNKNTNDFKLKIVNNQLVSDLNEVTEVKHLKHCFSSSSSTSSSASSSSSDYGLDSGCGSLGTRSSMIECSSDSFSKVCGESVKKRTKKILTVLFDYETESKSYNECLVKCHFSVKKGEQVKVIRDYDEKFYLVATCLGNRIGFIPKEYTVDLNELKQRYKESILSSSNSSISEYNHSDEICKKLTHL